MRLIEAGLGVLVFVLVAAARIQHALDDRRQQRRSNEQQLSTHTN